MGVQAVGKEFVPTVCLLRTEFWPSCWWKSEHGPDFRQSGAAGSIDHLQSFATFHGRETTETKVASLCSSPEVGVYSREQSSLNIG